MIPKLSRQIEASIELMEVGLDRESIYEAINRDEFGGRSEAVQRKINQEKTQSRLRSLWAGWQRRNNLWADIKSENMG